METLFVIILCAILFYGSLLMFSDKLLKIYFGVEKNKYLQCENKVEERILFLEVLTDKAELLLREGHNFIREIKQAGYRQGSYDGWLTLISGLRGDLRHVYPICIESRLIVFSLKRLRLGVLKDAQLRWRLRFFCFRWDSFCFFTKYILPRCPMFWHSPRLVFSRGAPIWIPF